MRKIQNNSLAMVATVAVVGILALGIGYLNPENCVGEQVEGWSSCSAIAAERGIAFWALVAIAVIGFGVSLCRKKKAK